MNSRVFCIAILFVTLQLPSLAYSAPPAVASAEIDYLLGQMATSGCDFYRNGSWYDGTRAKTHLRTKYDYLVARHLIGSAEDFIDKAATKSSISGKPYKIRCSDGVEVASGPWLHLVLARYRASARER